MQNWKNWLREISGFAIIILLVTGFRSAIADWNDVPTGSMLPTIVEGDRILVDKMAYDLRVPFTHLSLKQFDNPKRGEIIIFESAAADKRLVKRVIGVPGDLVAMQDNRLIINGVEAEYAPLAGKEGRVTLQERWGDMQHTIQLVQNMPGRLSNFGPVQVPDGQYLVMGDNRNNSADSRVIGFIPRDEIVGRGERVVVSFDYENYYLPRAERLLLPLQ